MNGTLRHYTLVLPLLCLGSTSSIYAQSEPSPANSPVEAKGAKTYPIDDCVDAMPRNEGVIRIVMPKSSDFNDIERRVKYVFKHLPESNDDSQNDYVGDRNKSRKGEPFHIISDDLPLSSFTGKYILVKIIIRNTKDSGFSFYDEEDSPINPNIKGIHGVGASDPLDGIVCGHRELKEKNGRRQVASFFIDVEKLKAKLMNDDKYKANFNIAIKLNDYPDTPIFIDPKIHNEG